jgi:hypothetical protein
MLLLRLRVGHELHPQPQAAPPAAPVAGGAAAEPEAGPEAGLASAPPALRWYLVACRPASNIKPIAIRNTIEVSQPSTIPSEVTGPPGGAWKLACACRVSNHARTSAGASAATQVQARRVIARASPVGLSGGHGTAGRDRRGRRCPWSDSNAHCTDFESVSSAGWDTGAGGSATETDTRIRELSPMRSYRR